MKMKAIDRLMKTIQTIGAGNRITMDELIQRSNSIGTNLKKVEVSNTINRKKIEDKLPGVVTYSVEHRTLFIGVTRDITDADLQSFVRIPKARPVAKNPRKKKTEVQAEVQKAETNLESATETTTATDAVTAQDDTFFATEQG